MTSETASHLDRPGSPSGWMTTVGTPGIDLLVPACFYDWDHRQQEGYLVQRRVNAAEAELVAFAYDCVRAATLDEACEDDPYEVAAATLGTTTALTRSGASRLVTTAVEMTERLPMTGALLAAGWIGLYAAHIIVEETLVVDDSRIAEVDRLVAERLAPTRRRTHPPRFGPLRKTVTRAVARADPAGAEARAREARGTQDVAMRPAGDDLAVVSARIGAAEAVEIMERVEALVRSAPKDDPRTVGQRRAAGLLALTRGWTCLPDPEGNPPGEPGAAAAARRVVLHVYATGDDDEVTIPPSGPVALAGYGPVTRLTGDELVASAGARLESVAALADPDAPGALRYAPSEALRRFCAGRGGTCVFPGCRIPAENCDCDHIIPFDHDHPERGGRTTSDDLADLCRFHHRLKTDGLWAYFRNPDGTYTWIHGPRHPDRDPGTRITVEPSGPLAGFSAPRDPECSRRQREAAEAGRTGGTGGRRPRAHRRDRIAAERRRRRAGEGGAGAGGAGEPGAA